MSDSESQRSWQKKLSKAKEAPPLEKVVERYFKDMIRRFGGRALKYNTPGRRSAPDRICMFPGARIFFVEIKRIGGELSPGQIEEHKLLTELGFKVFTLYGHKEVDKFARGVLPALISV